MASRYAILPASTASNYSSTGTWSATSGGGTGASSPTSADDVLVDALSVGGAGASLVIDAAASCLSMNWTGATNNPTFTVNNVLAYYGNVTLIAAMTINGTGGFCFNSDGNQTFTSNGVSIGCVFAAPLIGAGKLTLLDNLVVTNSGSDALGWNKGTLDTNNMAVTVTGTILIWGEAVKTFTLGTSVITCGGWNYTGSNLTITANTATINISGTGVLTGGSANWNGASFNLNGTAHTVSGSFTCNVLTRNGTATKTDTVTFTSGITITCTTFAMKGNSSTNRLLVLTSTLGSAATITATNWTGTQNVDLMDITATNAVDLSAITGLSGDCGGNAGITFTTAATQTSSAAGNYSGAVWGAGRVPLPQDDANISHSLTVDMLRIGKNIVFAGAPTVTLANTLEFYGSLTISSGTTWASGNTWLLARGRGATYALTTNNVAIGGLGVNMPTGTLDLTGTILTLKATPAGVKWYVNAGSVITTGSTIVLTNAGVNAQTFAGGSLTYNNVTIAGAGAYALTITGSNTFKTLTVDSSVAVKTITGTAATTQTIRSLVVKSSPSLVAVFNSTGAAWTITGQEGIFEGNWLNITNVAVSEKYKYYAGDNSTDGGGTTNWLFKRRIRYTRRRSLL